MSTDVLIPWLIALAICSGYGFFMYRRGYYFGAFNTASFIVKALIDQKKMTEQQITAVLQKAYDEAVAPMNDEES